MKRLKTRLSPTWHATQWPKLPRMSCLCSGYRAKRISKIPTVRSRATLARRTCLALVREPPRRS